MSEPQFDPGGFYQFDLAQGEIRSRGGHRVLMLSESVLAPLVHTAVQAGDLTAVRTLGSQLGKIIASSLGASVESQPPEVVLSHAASVVALYGWGRLELEQWGDTMVLRVDGLPPLDDENLAVAALLGGLFSRLIGKEVACVPLATSNQYIMVDPGIAEEVWGWAKDGYDVAQIVARLGESA